MAGLPQASRPRGLSLQLLYIHGGEPASQRASEPATVEDSEVCSGCNTPASLSGCGTKLQVDRSVRLTGATWRQVRQTGVHDIVAPVRADRFCVEVRDASRVVVGAAAAGVGCRTELQVTVSIKPRCRLVVVRTCASVHHGIIVMNRCI